MNIALILSGGTGNRVGADIPKQYIEVQGRMIISYCLETVVCHPEIDAIQIVAENEWRQPIMESVAWRQMKAVENEGRKIGELCECNCGVKFKGFSEPGANRQLSIFNGLKDILNYADEKDVVLIHDAARPMLSAQMISECLSAIADSDGVLPVLPMKDTVYRSVDRKMVTELLERSTLYAGQAPEAFRLGQYYRANETLLPDKIMEINGSSEPAVLAGMNVQMIPGDERNFKITTREDLKRFEDCLKMMGRKE